MRREELLRLVEARYGVAADYPFARDGESAVLRHPAGGKWFALLMTVPRARLGLPGEGRADVLNVKADPLLVASLRGEPGFLPAYHMNKAHWLTFPLDGGASDDQILALLDGSWDRTRPRTRPCTRPRTRPR